MSSWSGGGRAGSWGGGGGGPAASPALGRRVAIMGFIAVALFAIVFFRLWFLQVLSGNDYVQQARDNRVRIVSLAAPRGQILDRNGKTLVENKPGTVVQIEPSKLPAAERDAAAEWGQKAGQRAARPKARRGPQIAIPPVPDAALAAQFGALAKVTGMKPSEIQEIVIQQLAQVPYAPVRLKVGVREDVRNYLVEYAEKFPAVSVNSTYLRTYPQKELAAQIMGTVGQISPDQLKEKRFRGAAKDNVVGQSGMEWSYDQYLRGINGRQRITVDAQGRPKSSRVATEPTAGRAVELSLDLGLQKVGQQALSQHLVGPAFAGAFVAMDPRNGEILAMGSAPSFDPNDLTKPMSQKTYEAKYGEGAGSPLVNRATSGLYPVGSIFKPITAFAGLSSGLRTPETTIEDNGFIKVGADHQKFQNAGGAANGPVDLRTALEVSSDVYFYEIGAEANRLKGQVIQTWARKLGLGHPTGVDLGEADGNIPDSAWRKRRNALEEACRKKTKKASCGITADLRNWSVGDNVQVAIGQGDLLATPLQMAVVYSAIANDGTIVTPHLGTEVKDEDGNTLQRLQPGPTKKVTLDPAARSAIMDGLHQAVAGSRGTSQAVFSDWPQDKYKVYGKTGTAQRPPHADQSWYATFVNDPKRPIVIVATVEDGEFGADTAAPTACAMLARWYDVKASCAAGTNGTKE